MKRLFKTVLVLLVSLMLLLVSGASVMAATPPDFPTCSNPSGTLVVSYVDGSHGIIGSTATYVGSDKVYSLGDGNYTQCFCAADNSGIQTNWWKISSLNQDEIQTLKNLGWYFVPDGSVWGLQEGSYMAKNTSFSCGGGSSTTTQAGAPVCTAEKPLAPFLLSVVRNGTEATLTWSKVEKATHYVIAYGTVAGLYPYGVPNTGNVTTYKVGALDPNKQYQFQVYAVNDCMPSDPSRQGGGQVLGLATTGTAQTILLFTLAGLVLTSTGYLLARSKSN